LGNEGYNVIMSEDQQYKTGKWKATIYKLITRVSTYPNVGFSITTKTTYMRHFNGTGKICSQKTGSGLK